MPGSLTDTLSLGTAGATDKYDIGTQPPGLNMYLGEVLVSKAMALDVSNGCPQPISEDRHLGEDPISGAMALDVSNFGPQGHGQVKYCLGDNVNSLHP